MLISIFNGLSVIPFYSHSDVKRDYQWAFHRDEMLREEYRFYKETTGEINKFREEKLELTPYEIYTNGLGPQSPLKDFILDIIMIPFVAFAFFLPRPRGLRVNRKKRVIYWQTILGSHSIAFVPEKGDPLGGINYSRFGLYA
ncbi:hypothetical protein HYE62_00210, partial [Aggregatibacter actinomycetemcomitans]|nr:hypothetical protein [Aggregatibacter actinomycetemcomitans]MBN6082673.1 hypothetical protein [Aggregatibacter actinomycetemcomitans]